MAWGKHEKSIYRKGFFRGLYHEKDKKAVKEMKRRDVDYVVAERYAEHMGSKYGLSRRQIGRNINKHYQQAKKDKKFAGELRGEYLTPQEKEKLRLSRKAEQASKKVSNPKSQKAPVYDYSKDFDFTSRGRIKGSYIDGRFEPD